jgi:uncharacterized protein (DUF1015 family)
MAKIIPFKAVRPSKDKVHLVASRSVDTYSNQEMMEKLKTNPYTFLHVINPDFGTNEKTKPGSLERLHKVKEKYLEFVANNNLIEDKEPAYYIYSQIKNGITFTGIIGCISIDDYQEGIIKKHEQTLTEREEKLMHYLEVCNFNAEPVLFCYPNDKIIEEVTNLAMQTNPEYDFTTTDNVHHKLWVVNNVYAVEKIKSQFEKINHIYIADGHHRSASSYLLGKSKRLQKSDFNGTEAFNFYLGVFFPETQLQIVDFNRLVKDLNNLTVENFIVQLSENFEVRKVSDLLYKPLQKHHFAMYLEGAWYSLFAKSKIIRNEEPVGSLDASILTQFILSPILNIHDLKTDKRIGFMPGIKGMQALKHEVDSGNFKLAFALFPVEMTQLKLIADTDNIMPPKTTWVEPKMRNAMVIYDLSK